MLSCSSCSCNCSGSCQRCKAAVVFGLSFNLVFSRSLLLPSASGRCRTGSSRGFRSWLSCGFSRRPRRRAGSRGSHFASFRLCQPYHAVGWRAAASSSLWCRGSCSCASFARPSRLLAVRWLLLCRGASLWLGPRGWWPSSAAWWCPALAWLACCSACGCRGPFQWSSWSLFCASC